MHGHLYFIAALAAAQRTFAAPQCPAACLPVGGQGGACPPAETHTVTTEKTIVMTKTATATITATRQPYPSVPGVFGPGTGNPSMPTSTITVTSTATVTVTAQPSAGVPGTTAGQNMGTPVAPTNTAPYATATTTPTVPSGVAGQTGGGAYSTARPTRPINPHHYKNPFRPGQYSVPGASETGVQKSNPYGAHPQGTNPFGKNPQGKHPFGTAAGHQPKPSVVQEKSNGEAYVPAEKHHVAHPVSMNGEGGPKRAGAEDQTTTQAAGAQPSGYMRNAGNPPAH